MKLLKPSTSGPAAKNSATPVRPRVEGGPPTRSLLDIPVHAPVRRDAAGAVAETGVARPRVEGGPLTRSLLDIPVHAPIRHDDAAGAVAKAADARAVTIGSQIYMAPTAYQPGTQRGKELIAHEQVHVAQNQLGRATGESAVGAAEAEARRLAPMIARDGWQGISITQRGAPVLRDAMPEQDLSDDRKKIAETIEDRNPWLLLLSNREAIVKELTERIASERRLVSALATLNKLPDPAKTYLSDEIDRRKRIRAPVERKLQREFGERDKHPTWVKFDLNELVSVELRTQALTSTGAAAVIHELQRHQGWIHLDRNGLDSFRYGLDVQIDDVWLPIEIDGIHLNAFFKDAVMTSTMARFQGIYLEATSKQMDELLAEFVDDAPDIAQQELDRFIAEHDAAQLPPQHTPTPDEQLIEDYVTANKQYAETVRAKTQQAMAPLIFIAGLFEIDGPVDLLLAVFPADKIGAELFKLGKKAVQARKARKLEQLLIKEFEGHLDEEAKAFIKLARGLEKSEIRAVKTIRKFVKNDVLIVKLMERSIHNGANLEWIAKKLEKGKFDEGFVRAFTAAESGLSWKVFEDIVEGRKGIDEGVRTSFAAKMKGLIGEEAALKVVRTNEFKALALGARADAKILSITREVSYGGTKSLDLVALTEKSDLVFGEVKHLNTNTWGIPRTEVELLAQLDEHNVGIREIAKRMNRRVGDRRSYS